MGRKRSLVILVAVITVPVILVVIIFVGILDTNLMLKYDRQIIINYLDECMYIYFEMYKDTYGYMYLYTFFNNNTMHLIVLLLKIKQLKEETSVI